MKRIKLEEIEIKKLFSRVDIEDRIKVMAREIATDYSNEAKSSKFKLVLVGILNGAVPFIGDLARELSNYFPVGSIEIDFIAISSYKGTKSGPVKLEKDTKSPLSGKHVVVIEDIIDTGKTLREVTRILLAKNPASLRVCVLIDKHRAVSREIDIHYVGFTVVGLSLIHI